MEVKAKRLPIDNDYEKAVKVISSMMPQHYESVSKYIRLFVTKWIRNTSLTFYEQALWSMYDKRIIDIEKQNNVSED